MSRQLPNATWATQRDAAAVLPMEQSLSTGSTIRDGGSEQCLSLEIEGRYDGGVIGLGIFSIDGEGGGLVVQDLVVDF
jgi:hypothetical protein